jgi:AAA+ superfamily predicted ATPase
MEGFMYFYKIDARMTNVDEKVTQEERYAKILQTRLTMFYQNSKDGTIFIVSMSDNRLTMGAIARNADWLNKNIPCFLAAAELDCKDITFEEVMFNTVKSLLVMSDRDDYVHDTGELLEQFGLNRLSNRCNLSYTEHMLLKPMQKRSLIKRARELLCADTLIPEIERIYQPARETVSGHPVHYMIQSDNSCLREGIYKILISALYANGRLRNRRFSVVSLNEGNCKEKEITALYESCTDGALIIKLGEDTKGGLNAETRLLNAIFGRNDDDDTDRETDICWLDTICRIALKFHDKTLTIFCLPRASEKVKVNMREQLGIMTLVELTEDTLSGERAKAFLRRTARSRGVSADKLLYKIIDGESKSFSSSELIRAFDVWYNKRLKTFSYPQYASFESSGQTSAKAAYFGDSFAELEQLIGLNEAKSVIKQAIDYFKAQKLFRERGLNSNRPSMHMVFTGAPGTAKTTVARLFARIMRDNGLLSVGKLYEVGRADLVGKYVGWTAQKVENKFREAMGSVLFIDEAYSLVDDRECMYGDEAINAIVAEMENRREDIVVIFAGYSEKMQEFLKRNPGLRSRVTFHVPFADYNPEELFQILQHISGKQAMSLDDGVKDKLLPILSAASREIDFGNGRFARNLFEKARMKQAGRLLTLDVDNITTEQVTRLIADDFEAPAATQVSKRRIGFCVA